MIALVMWCQCWCWKGLREEKIGDGGDDDYGDGDDDNNSDEDDGGGSVGI